MRALFPTLCLLLAAEPTPAPWTDLIGPKAGTPWKDAKGWVVAADASLDAKNPRRLAPKDGAGVLVNGKAGRERDLYTKESFHDVEVELEFLIAKGSNSGIKFQGVYEIQICDSLGKKELTGDDCGGIYPRAELTPRYRHIDKGIAPKSNACKAPGEWQKLTVIFTAARFDADGKKTANARIVKATLNGTVIHENVELKTPTATTGRRRKSPRGRSCSRAITGRSPSATSASGPIRNKDPTTDNTDRTDKTKTGAVSWSTSDYCPSVFILAIGVICVIRVIRG